MLELFFSSIFFQSIHQMVESVIRISIYIFTFGVVVYFIALIYRISNGTESNDHFYHLIFVISSAIGLATYQLWSVWLGKLFVLIARAIFDLEDGNIMSEYLSAFFNEKNNQSIGFSLLNFFSLETLSSLSYFLVLIVYEIFVIIQVIVQIFIYMLGPFAIVLSLFSSFRNSFRVWLVNFCSVNFWSVLIAILFRLVTTLVNSSQFQQAIQSGDKSVLWESFILGILLCVVIVLIPKISTIIFQGAGVVTGLGSYGTALTAGVFFSGLLHQSAALSQNLEQILKKRNIESEKRSNEIITESKNVTNKMSSENSNMFPFVNTTVRNMQDIL